MVIKNPFADVLSLSVGERLALLEYIWDSVVDQPEPVPLTDEHRRELDARLDSYRRDPSAGMSWDVVKARVIGPR